MKKPILQMAAIMGLVAGMNPVQGAMTNMAPAQPQRRRVSTDTTRRYLGMTKEQADWNAAIDKKKAGKP